jgi:hypothetical protein
VLSRLDDLPIHQSPAPVARPATTDRNAYDRYWFGGVAVDGSFMFEAAFGRYPNLGVVDASVSLLRDGHQDAFHASGAAPAEPTRTDVGPVRLEVVEPMRELRLTVAGNETGISADLTWRSRVGALQEDHTVMEDQGTVIVDMARFVQFGSWAGSITVDGATTSFEHHEVRGTRDRSWGIRPVGERPNERPMSLPSTCWLWAPIHFDHECRSLGFFQHPGGEIWRGDGFVLPIVDPVEAITPNDAAGVVRTEPRGQRLTFHPGSRWISAAELDVEVPGGEDYTLVLEPVDGLRFSMRGLGYTNPEWGHGFWKGPLAVSRESWDLDAIEPLDPYFQHVHHAVRARIVPAGGGPPQTGGVGFLEQIIFGPHTQMGFQDFLDGAPTP